MNDDAPLLFHTGLKGMFPAVSDAVATVMPVDRLRWIMFGHLEADECGAMNRFLEAAPNAQSFGCSSILNSSAREDDINSTATGNSCCSRMV